MPAEAAGSSDPAERGPGVLNPDSAALLFQSNPKTDPDSWDVRTALAPGHDDDRRVVQQLDEMRPGRLVLFWRARGEDAPEVRGLYGWGITTGGPFQDPSDDSVTRIRVRYVERWILDADAEAEPGDQTAPVAAERLFELESWRGHRLERNTQRASFTVTLDQLHELTTKLVAPRFTGSELSRAIEVVEKGGSLEVEEFTSDWIAEEPPLPESQAVSLRILSDSPIRSLAADRLGFAKYANAIAGLINEKKTSTPLTLAINARWGVGKSSLAHLIEDALKSRSRLDGKPHVTCWFDAWMHDDAEDLTPSLLALVARTADRERPLWRRVFQPIPILLLPSGERWRGRIFRFGLYLLIGAALSVVALRLLMPDVDATEFWRLGQGLLTILDGGAATEAATQETIVGGGAWIAALALLFKVWSFFTSSAQAIASFVANPKDEAQSGSLPKVRQQIGSLIRQATGNGDRRFVLFVDDLERCRPPLAVSLLETLNQLLNHRDVVTIVMADMPGVEAHVQIKYEDLAARYQVAVRDIPEPVSDERVRTRTYGRHYQSKIIQLQFDLPRAVGTERLLEPPAQTKERTAGSALLVESLDRLFDFADGRSLSLLAPLRDNLERWREHGRLASTLVALLWVLGLPALFIGGLTEIVASLLPFSRVRDASLGSRADRGAAVLTLLSTVLCLPPALAMPLDYDPTAWTAVYAGTLAAVLLLVGFGRALEAVQQVRLRRRFAQRLDELLRERGTAVGTEAEAEFVSRELEADARLADFATRRAGKDLLREKRLNYLSESSDLLKAAWEPANEYLPHIPRHLKRFHNRLRLLLYIADQRQMFGDDAALVATQIGKWAVLQEVWPELAQKLADRPERMGALESDPEKTLRRRVPRYAEDTDLIRFLTSPPSLAKDLERLTNFRPAS